MSKINMFKMDVQTLWSLTIIKFLRLVLCHIRLGLMSHKETPDRQQTDRCTADRQMDNRQRDGQ